MQLVAVSLVTGLLWWQRGRANTVEAASDVMGLLFFILLFPAFRCVLIFIVKSKL